MRLNRFIGDFDIASMELDIRSAELLHQMREVLHLQTGEQIVLCDGRGGEAVFRIDQWTGRGVKVVRAGAPAIVPEPEGLPVLYCAILKKENFELVVQKAAEIGVSRIVPVITSHTVKLNIRQDRMEKILSEAAEQSGHVRVPKLAPPMEFSSALRDAAGNDMNVLFDRSGRDISEGQFLKTNRTGIFIGPEGGWHQDEIALARENGFQIFSLGKFTLRAETAAIVAVYVAGSPKK